MQEETEGDSSLTRSDLEQSQISTTINWHPTSYIKFKKRPCRLVFLKYCVEIVKFIVLFLPLVATELSRLALSWAAVSRLSSSALARSAWNWASSWSAISLVRARLSALLFWLHLKHQPHQHVLWLEINHINMSSVLEINHINMSSD